MDKPIQGSVLIKEVRKRLGRLGFASGAIGGMPPYAFILFLTMVKLIMKYLNEEIDEGNCRERVVEDKHEEEAFRADAKAENGR